AAIKGYLAAGQDARLPSVENPVSGLTSRRPPPQALEPKNFEALGPYRLAKLAENLWFMANQSRLTTLRPLVRFLSLDRDAKDLLAWTIAHNLTGLKTKRWLKRIRQLGERLQFSPDQKGWIQHAIDRGFSS
ncbi:MAG: hypothetical protein HY611_10240, partial [Elusimicrobia bacterium]|nr:hypothetical protein [Elusimicrobiota bacterium]